MIGTMGGDGERSAGLGWGGDGVGDRRNVYLRIYINPVVDGGDGGWAGGGGLEG